MVGNYYTICSSISFKIIYLYAKKFTLKGEGFVEIRLVFLL